MKKLLAVILLVGISFVSIFHFVQPSLEKPMNTRFIPFGKVDFSDDYDDYNSDYDTDDSDDITSRFGNFIKNHKTPFSKTVER
ncbi:hypothetical protein ABPH35_08870 [Streptococcus sp. ZJ93]|uniref:hypothetical protein n=1 Tax=Streptococcus handemini TaxID=3161188 RepID=UPI0032EC2881